MKILNDYGINHNFLTMMALIIVKIEICYAKMQSRLSDHKLSGPAISRRIDA